MRLGRFATDAQRTRAVEHIDRETRRLSHLVENVLRFARGVRGKADAGRRDPVDIARETAEIVAEFEPLATARRAQVVVEFAEPTPDSQVAMRPGTFRQVLLNLLDNAVKYGPVGQTVRVRCERGGRGAEGDGIRVSVIDEGPGVPASEREGIWRPFQRGSAAQEGAGGSGIGLTVVKEIVDEHDGRVWVEDAADGGAAFIVELPAHSTAVARQPSSQGHKATSHA